MAAFTRVTSRVVALPQNDVDTDQIIPARFLKTTQKTGLGANLFNDWRYDAAGKPKPDFALNRPGAAGSRILVAGDNFGCGSSREHAPWALADFGFQAVVARSFADIFRQNALKNGLLPVALDGPPHAALLAAVARDPAVQVTVDLEALQVELPDGSKESFTVDPFARRCLLEGLDELGYLLSFADRIAAHERREKEARA
jgi:3-isopropylmalate/(R)-2-methylmalate dehydratase small subunit